MLFAGVGAAASFGSLVVYYAPGLSDEGVDDFLFLLAIPGAALAFPFLLLAVLLRVKTVWIVSGSLMLLLMVATAVDVVQGVEDEPSLLVFAGTFFGNLIIVGLATVIDLAIRGGRKARRSLASRTPPDEKTEKSSLEIESRGGESNP